MEINAKAWLWTLIFKFDFLSGHGNSSGLLRPRSRCCSSCGWRDLQGLPRAAAGLDGKMLRLQLKPLRVASSFARFCIGLHVSIGSLCLDDSGFAAMPLASVSVWWLAPSG